MPDCSRTTGIGCTELCPGTGYLAGSSAPVAVSPMAVSPSSGQQWPAAASTCSGAGLLHVDVSLWYPLRYLGPGKNRSKPVVMPAGQSACALRRSSASRSTNPRAFAVPASNSRKPSVTSFLDFITSLSSPSSSDSPDIRPRLCAAAASSFP